VNFVNNLCIANAGKKIEEATTAMKKQVLRWTCCGALGAFAKPCTECPDNIKLRLHNNPNSDETKTQQSPDHANQTLQTTAASSAAKPN